MKPNVNPDPVTTGCCPPMDVARVIQVIETTIERRGAGVQDDPVRVITQYWTLDGVLLAEVDPCRRPNAALSEAADKRH